MLALLKVSPVVIPIILILILFLGGDKYFSDSDGDGINDIKDNCPDRVDPTQDVNEYNIEDECEQSNIEKKMAKK